MERRRFVAMALHLLPGEKKESSLQLKVNKLKG